MSENFIEGIARRAQKMRAPCPFALFSDAISNPSCCPCQRQHNNRLVSVLGELCLGLLVDLGALLGIGQLSPGGLLPLVVGSTLDFTSLLESTVSVSGIPTAYNLIETHLSTTSLYFQPNS